MLALNGLRLKKLSGDMTEHPLGKPHRRILFQRYNPRAKFSLFSLTIVYLYKKLHGKLLLATIPENNARPSSIVCVRIVFTVNVYVN